MMGSRCLFLRLPTTSLSTTTTLASTWGRRILTEKSTGSLIFFARSPFNARLEENKNKGKRGNTNTTRLLIESRRYYFRPAISPPRSDDPKLKSAGNEYRSESEITKLCKENKSLEAFELFQKEPTIVGAKDLLNYYKPEGDKESLNSLMRVYSILTQSKILPDQNFLGNLMYFCNRHNQFHSTLNLFADMEKYHIKVTRCFSKITFAAFKANDKDVAKKMFQLIKDGNDIKANAFVCNNILSVLANFDDAMWIFDYMLKNNIEFDEGCVIEFLKACISEASLNDQPAILEKGKLIHQQITKLKLDSNTKVLNALIQMYAKCGEPHKSVELYEKMIENNIKPDQYTFSHILTAISNLGPIAIKLGEYIHQQITQQKFDSDVVLINLLIRMYDKCGEPHKSVEVYDKMISSNITPTEITFVSILTAISNIGPKALEKGKHIYQHIVQFKFDSNIKIISSLIQMYTKCGEPNTSFEIFDHLVQKQIKIDKFIFTNVLSAISNIGPKALEKGKRIHQQITLHKVELDSQLTSTLMEMYNKCGEPNTSLEIYDKIPSQEKSINKFIVATTLSVLSTLGPNALERGKQIHQEIIQHKLDLDTVLLNALIQMYDKCGEPHKSVEIYDKMIESNITPDEFTFINILTAISNIGPSALEKGKQIHQQIKEHKFDSNINLITSLIQMYDKCGEPNKSLELHTDLASRVDITQHEVTLLTVLNACAHLGEVMTTFKQKFKILSRLRNFYYRNNENEAQKQVSDKYKEFKESPQYLYTQESFAKAIEKGKQIHQQIASHQDLSHNQLLTSALMKMYTFCGEYDESEKLFDQLQIKDDYAFHFILITYSYRGSLALERGKKVHQFITQHNFDTIRIIFNSLIQMYRTCGEPENAIKLYEQLHEKNIAPNEYTYTHVLSALSQIGNGALEKGKELHQRIISEGLDTNTFVLNSLIEMYNKCGEPHKSLEIYDHMVSNNMPLDEYTFRYALEACTTIGPDAFEKGKKIHQDLLNNRVF